MTFDDNFENTRLNILAQQFPQITNKEGKVLFFADTKDNRISHATWLFDDEHYQLANDSGFKLQLMELLDTFIIYRGEFDKTPRGQGTVFLSHGKISIEWS